MEVLYERCVGCPSGDGRGPCAAARGMAPADERGPGELGRRRRFLRNE
jgi:hypothetical protein